MAEKKRAKSKARAWSDADLLPILDASERGDGKKHTRLLRSLVERFGSSDAMHARLEALRDERWESLPAAERRRRLTADRRAELARILDAGVRPFGYSDPPRTSDDRAAIRDLARIRTAVFEDNDAAYAALVALRFASFHERRTDRRLWPHARKGFAAAQKQPRAARAGGMKTAEVKATEHRDISRAVDDAIRKGGMTDLEARRFVGKKADLSLSQVNRIRKKSRETR